MQNKYNQINSINQLNTQIGHVICVSAVEGCPLGQTHVETRYIASTGGRANSEPWNIATFFDATML